MAGQQPPTLANLITSLTALSLPTPTTTFLQPILTPPNSNPNSTRAPPLVVLTATAKHRLLSASITSSPTTSTPSILVPATPALPVNVANVRVKERGLGEDVFVQVLDIQDLGRSRWEQIEGLEAERKGETMKGREVIRVVPVEEEMGMPGTQFPQGQNINQNQNQGNGSVNMTGDKASRGPFKLLMQDWKGMAVWGFEVRRVEKVGLPPVMGIGCKLLLRRGTRVARGMVLLEPGNVVVFGGKIDAEDKAWRAGREDRLRRE
ncbi:hypothetical protein IFR05_017446, partial [Cadophora sp. M221]